MLAGAGRRFSDWLVAQGSIKPDDKGIYAYGMEIGLASVLNFAATLAIGFAFGMVWEVILFLAAYVPLRSYAGGYHASTHLRCGVFFAVMIAVVLGIMSYLPVAWYRAVAIFGALVPTLVIMKMAPVEDLNKPLDEKEWYVFAEKTYNVLSLELCISISLLLFDIERPAVMLALTISSVACMLIMGAIKNRQHRRANVGQ